MAKTNPDYQSEEISLLGRKDLEEWLSGLFKRIQEDDDNRSGWLEEQNHNYNRRYGLLGRGTDFPWPGASDIVIPMSDITIDRVKPTILGLITNSNPTVTFQPMKPDSVEKAQNAEFFFEWLLKTKVPDFITQAAVLVDDILQKGFGIAKVLYEYSTETSMQVIRKDHLPGRLQQLFVVKGAQAKATQAFMESRGQKLPMTTNEFDRLRTQIEELVINEFGLDREEPMDAKALSKIMSFMREGGDEITVKFREVKKNYPRMVAVDPIDLILPSYTRDLEEATRITHRMYFTKEGLLRKVRDSKWDEEAVDVVIDKKNKKGGSIILANLNSDLHKAQREGISAIDTDGLYEIYETCTYFDIDGDGYGERVIVTWHPDSKVPFKLCALPYDHGQWPYTQIRFELNDMRFYSSRGIPEKIKDLDEEITQQHRAKLNRMTIANAPTFKYRKGSGFNPARIRWLPGEFYGVGNMQDFDSIQIPNLDVSFDREEAILRSTIEAYVGTSDFAISSPTAKPSEPRTATEISLVQETSNRALGYRSLLFQNGMKRVYGQMWDLYLQYGPDEEYVRVANDEPVRLTRKEIQGDFDLIPSGSIGSTNPALEEQKALARLQILTQFAPLIAQDPRYSVDMGRALLDYFYTTDRVRTKRFIQKRSPEEVQQIMQEQQQQKAIAQNQPVPLDTLVEKLEKAEAMAPAGGNQLVSG